MKRIHYAWIVAAVTFIALMGAAGFRATPGVLIVPLEHEFGWNRAVISFAVFINLLLFGLTGPFAAALMNRFGIRTVTVGALITVATGALLTTVMTAPWQLYLLWGVVVGLGTGCMASVLAATVASRWFVQRRGLVIGALTAAGAMGQLIFLPFLGWLAQNRAGAAPRSRSASRRSRSCRSSRSFSAIARPTSACAPTAPPPQTRDRSRSATRSATPFAAWALASARVISGCWRAASLSAGHPPTA